MRSLEALRGRKVLLATEDSFVGNYLKQGLGHWGIEVFGPVNSMPDLLALAEQQGQPALACISVNMPGLDGSLEATLKERGVPYFLFGVPMSGKAWASAAMLWPFSTFQLAQELLALRIDDRVPEGS